MRIATTAIGGITPGGIVTIIIAAGRGAIGAIPIMSIAAEATIAAPASGFS